MTDGFVLARGGGEPIGGGGPGMTLKAGVRHAAAASIFETTVGPGFDVGAHLHQTAEEFFYILEGELDLLAFEPRVRTEDDWLKWESADGKTVVRAGPGSFMFVPTGCPHAFFNPGPAPTRMVFGVAPAGHELYLEDLAQAVRSGGRGRDVVAEVRRRHDIHQLTPMAVRRPTG